MSSLVQTLTASGGPESPGFLNDLVKQLWPNLAVAVADTIKQSVEPMLDSMLPSPLDTLRFVKIDLGHVPVHLDKVDVHSTENGGIKLDLDLSWDGACDIELDGKMTPKIGVEHVKLYGRLSVLLCPLTNVLPCVGALQIAFINKPSLKMTYTDAAGIASLGVIDKALRKVIIDIISSMAVLPNRFLVKLDAANDWFKTYQHPLGVLRLTVESGSNLGEDAGETKNLLKRLVHDVPDCFATVNLSAEPEWRTKTVKNSRHPEWRETHNFLVTDHEQAIELDVKDEDTASDDDIGIATATVKQLLLAGGRQELRLVHKGEETAGRLAVSAEFYRFVPDPASLSGSEPEAVLGLLSVLVAAVRGLKGRREELKPSVRVDWGEQTFRTAIKTDAPGTDIENPSFDQAFQVPLKAGMVNGAPPVKLTLMNAEHETGSVEVPLDEVLRAPSLRLEKVFGIGNGVTLSAGIWLRGVKLAE
ncbi:hypothetical protein MYCTH_2309630 [Thermothelomyces thermophilus ATCC 42464]|uniref:C2 domain-containing protein n=1 Tax=Thermothelomyces thermophilus (strain ATCC 42464 / BCRC 31852 / DSM 1799) TaxID=573729 RepID=G2QJ14_THET4|nr:uncharacterized protein MYCTH_2309630 [Thermothelomyces thermophilus ATCC 42464]AEO60433.1 hypothetical protein MYCTH_2309630 [Thermothelomyces thermophilus ATCC 42464]